MESFVADVAREIDRLVIAGHAAAARHERPASLAGLTAQPGLLNTLAVAWLRRPVSREVLGRVLGYTPPHLLTTIVDDNLDHGVIENTDDGLALTAPGRRWAEGVVDLQERAVEAMWLDASLVSEMGTRVLSDAPPPPASPSTFALFADTWDRPTEAARALRTITALRYWRADAHRRALEDTGLAPRTAHALNVLWDAHRQVTRVGQGFTEPGTKGLADLVERDLADGEVITDAGIALRESVEVATDEHTAPMYAGLDAAARRSFVDALAALSAD